MPSPINIFPLATSGIISLLEIVIDPPSVIVTPEFELPPHKCTTPVPLGEILIFALFAVVEISKVLAAFISIPPALAVTCNASASVPVEDNIRLELVSPVTAIVKSSPLSAEANVISEARTASIENPPAVAVMAIASEAVPAVFVNEIFSFAAVACGVNTISVAPV